MSDTTEQAIARIKKQLAANSIVLYMKGSRDFPQCGFSAQAVNILNAYGMKYLTVDVLQDEAIRQAIKQYGDWPTIPQLYVAGELIGGSDIMRDLHEKNALKAQLLPGIA